MNSMTRLLIWLVLFLVLVLNGCTTHPKVTAQVFVRPGVFADKVDKRIILDAEGTEATKNTIIEYLVIGADSGHGYESLFKTMAKPSDVKAALEFIGMTPGRATDYSKARLWPKGERVSCMVTCPSNSFSERKIETMIYNNREKRVMTASGFTFIGSRQIPSREKPSQTVFAADAREPNSIISDYNEPDSILDVPRFAPQDHVYESMVLNPEFVPGEGRPVKLIIEPENKNGKLRVQDILMRVALKSQKSTSLGDLRITLTDSKGIKLCDNAELSDSVKIFQKMAENGQDPFLVIVYDANLPLKLIRDISSILAALEQENGIKIDEPAEGTLYYKAFIPDNKFRERKDRLAQPWELHLIKDNQLIKAELIKLEEIWQEDESTSLVEVKEHKYNLTQPSVLLSTLKNNGPGLPVIIVYASEDVTNGELMQYLSSVIGEYPTVHVFIE